MKAKTVSGWVVLQLACTLLLVSPAKAASAPVEATPAEAKAAYADMTKTFGFVPTFMQMYPKAGIAYAWEQMKLISLNPNGPVPTKYAQMMALGVAAQIPCKYCTYFHTEAAKLGGATETELREAVTVASNTRQWSAILYGAQTDEAAFHKEVDQMMSHLRQEMKKAEDMAKAGKPMAQPEMAMATDAKSARAAMEQTFGMFPSFMNAVPESLWASSFNGLMAVVMNPKSAIPSKYKDLISVAVASQIPCKYCTYMDTESAKLDGASQEEIQHAYLEASQVRHWSTFLNGLQIDERAFRAEVDRIMKHLRKTMASKKPIASR